jgi:NAD-dependent SIR2 family protein deacetylase
MPPTPSSDIAAFHALLTRNPSPRILALCGAGLSASSGLPTFRGAGGLWRNKQAVALADVDAFTRDPALVWLFYAYRRHAALTSKPNVAHRALTALAEKQENFLCLTQNVDSEIDARYI